MNNPLSYPNPYLNEGPMLIILIQGRRVKIVKTFIYFFSILIIIIINGAHWFSFRKQKMEFREGLKKKLLENSNKGGGSARVDFPIKKINKKKCAKNTWNCLKTILRQTCFFQLWPPLPPPQTCPDMSTDWLSKIKQRKAITWSVGIKKITHIIQNSFHGA